MLSSLNQKYLKVGKHQEVEDYHLSVPQMDMEQLVSVKRWIRDCRSMYQVYPSFYVLIQTSF